MLLISSVSVCICMCQRFSWLYCMRSDLEMFPHHVKWPHCVCWQPAGCPHCSHCDVDLWGGHRHFQAPSQHYIHSPIAHPLFVVWAWKAAFTGRDEWRGSRGNHPESSKRSKEATTITWRHPTMRTISCLCRTSESVCTDVPVGQQCCCVRSLLIWSVFVQRAARLCHWKGSGSAVSHGATVWLLCDYFFSFCFNLRERIEISVRNILTPMYL